MASAATEVGNDCIATNGLSGVAMVQLADAPGNPLPLTAPTAGVVTKWKVTRGFTPIETLEDKLKVYRATGSANQFEVVGESPLEVIDEGPNSFDAQIPVQAGDRFGLYGTSPSGGIFCETESSQDVLGQSVGDSPLGSTQDFKEVPNKRVAVSALVEPDVDRDGWGDETQDKCPRSAAIQLVQCSRLTLASYAIARKGSALLLVSTDGVVPVTASGTVKLGKGSKKRARTSVQARLAAVTQTVAPGQIAKFKLVFPKSLKAALAKLPQKRSLPLKLEAKATDLTGSVTTTTTSLKLKGRLRPGG